MHETTTTATLSSRRAWWGLATLTLPVLLVSMDFSVLYLAIPSITTDLDPSATQQLWILDVYGFAIAGLLITMGNVGDRIGRRRVLLAGSTVFGLGSVLAAFAPDAELLIASRALMGIGGATLLPSSLSLIANMFSDPRDRGRAIGAWTAAFAGGSAIGPVVGGVLLHHFWWGAVFLINVPVLAVLLLVGPRLLPEYREPTDARFDVPGVVLSLLGILPVVYAVKDVASHGPHLRALVLVVVGVVALVAFVARQRRAAAPLVDLHLFRSPAFSAAIASSLVGMMTFGAMSYLTGVHLQTAMGLDVLVAAIAGIPLAITVGIFSISATRLATRGYRWPFVGGLLLAALGNLGLVGLRADGPVWVYLAATAVAGVGYGIVFSLVSDFVVGSVPPERSGAASGVSETSFELGTALGLALLGSLATFVFRAGADGRPFADTLGETVQQADRSGDGALAQAARVAFTDGLHTASVASAVMLVLLAGVVAVAMRRR